MLNKYKTNLLRTSVVILGFTSLTPKIGAVGADSISPACYTLENAWEAAEMKSSRAKFDYDNAVAEYNELQNYLETQQAQVAAASDAANGAAAAIIQYNAKNPGSPCQVPPMPGSAIEKNDLTRKATDQFKGPAAEINAGPRRVKR